MNPDFPQNLTFDNVTLVNGVTISGTAAFSNAVTVGGTLGVTGATTLSTLGVSGAATLGSATVTGAATVGTTLGVTGATTLSNSLSVGQSATIAGLLGVTGAVTLTSPLLSVGNPSNNGYAPTVQYMLATSGGAVYELDSYGGTTGFYTTTAANTQATPQACTTSNENRWLAAFYNGTAYKIGGGIEFIPLNTHTSTDSAVWWNIAGTAPATNTRVKNVAGYALGMTVSDTAAAIPVATAVLEVDSTTRGFLPPRMTTTQKNAISSPATGLVVFDTTLAKLCVYGGSAWQTITSV